MRFKSWIGFGAIALAATLPCVARGQDGCTAELDGVAAEVTTLVVAPKVDVAKLMTKVTSAREKVSDGKPLDAAAKMDDLIATVEVLVERYKVEAASGQELIDAAYDARTCLLEAGAS